MGRSSGDCAAGQPSPPVAWVCTRGATHYHDDSHTIRSVVSAENGRWSYVLCGESSLGTLAVAYSFAEDVLEPARRCHPAAGSRLGAAGHCRHQRMMFEVPTSGAPGPKGSIGRRWTAGQLAGVRNPTVNDEAELHRNVFGTYGRPPTPPSRAALSADPPSRAPSSVSRWLRRGILRVHGLDRGDELVVGRARGRALRQLVHHDPEAGAIIRA